MAMLPKKGEWIKCVSTSDSAPFSPGCDYHVEKVSKAKGMVTVYNDDGEQCAIDFPHDPTYGKFEIKD